jgi:transposase-like protein
MIPLCVPEWVRCPHCGYFMRGNSGMNGEWAVMYICPMCMYEHVVEVSTDD